MDVLTYGCCHGGIAVAMDGGCPWRYERERALESKRQHHLSNIVKCLNSVYNTLFQYNAWHCFWTHTIASASKEAMNGLDFGLYEQRTFEDCAPQKTENISQYQGRMCSKMGCWGEGRAVEMLTKWEQWKRLVSSIKFHRLSTMF